MFLREKNYSCWFPASGWAAHAPNVPGGSHVKPLGHRRRLSISGSFGSTKHGKKSGKYLPVSSGILGEPKASCRRDQWFLQTPFPSRTGAGILLLWRHLPHPDGFPGVPRATRIVTCLPFSPWVLPLSRRPSPWPWVGLRHTVCQGSPRPTLPGEGAGCRWRLGFPLHQPDLKQSCPSASVLSREMSKPASRRRGVTLRSRSLLGPELETQQNTGILFPGQLG